MLTTRCVNKEGLRYVNEEQPARRFLRRGTLLNQVKSLRFVINDQTEIDSVQIPQEKLDYMVEKTACCSKANR